MSMQDAKRFIEETAQNRELMEKVRAIDIGSDETSVAFYARAAKSLGYDFSAEELEEAMKAQQEKGLETVDKVELSLEELDNVAGGWCTFSNNCSKVINYKKHNKNCEYTFEEGENCIMLDDCNLASTSYYCTEGPYMEKGDKKTYFD